MVKSTEKSVVEYFFQHHILVGLVFEHASCLNYSTFCCCCCFVLKSHYLKCLLTRRHMSANHHSLEQWDRKRLTQGGQVRGCTGTLWLDSAAVSTTQ